MPFKSTKKQLGVQVVLACLAGAWKAKTFLSDAHLLEVDCIHSWAVVLPKFSVKSPLRDYRRLAIQIWRAYGKLEENGVHLRFTCVVQKRLRVSSLICPTTSKVVQNSDKIFAVTKQQRSTRACARRYDR